VLDGGVGVARVLFSWTAAGSSEAIGAQIGGEDEAGGSNDEDELACTRGGLVIGAASAGSSGFFLELLFLGAARLSMKFEKTEMMDTRGLLKRSAPLLCWSRGLAGWKENLRVLDFLVLKPRLNVIAVDDGDGCGHSLLGAEPLLLDAPFFGVLDETVLPGSKVGAELIRLVVVGEVAISALSVAGNMAWIDLVLSPIREANSLLGDHREVA